MLKFKSIEIEDRKILKPYFDEWKFEGSELTFTNLFIWTKGVDIQYAIHEDVVYVMMLTESHKRFFMPPIPRRQDMDYRLAMRVARDYMHELGLRFVMRSANTKLKAKMECCCQDELLFVEDRGNWDYVYNAQDLLELKGKKYHGKRNHINRLLSEHSCEYIVYDNSYKDICWQLYERWMEGREVNPAEPHAMRAILDHFDELELKGGLLRIDGNIEAFTIGEQITDDMALIHMEKAGDIPGAYPYINQQFVEHEWSQMKYINREEDMGIEGLRKAKLSYNPAFMIEKFNVYERDAK